MKIVKDNVTLSEIVRMLDDIGFFVEFRMVGIAQNSCGDSPTILVALKEISERVMACSRKTSVACKEAYQKLHLDEIPLLDNGMVDSNRMKKMFAL